MTLQTERDTERMDVVYLFVSFFLVSEEDAKDTDCIIAFGGGAFRYFSIDALSTRPWQFTANMDMVSA